MTSINHICVVGLGYIGLPTASMFATNGFQVTGVDVSPFVVETISQGNIHIEEPGLHTVVQAAIKSGKLSATTRPVEADAFIIAVPTPITHEKLADMSFVVAAAKEILPVLRNGNLVVLESTSPPGTTRELLAPIFQEAGFELGTTLFLAHCPERVLPGRILIELVENHRVIGGYTPRCAELAKEMYKVFVAGEIHTTSATTAEMVKVMENTYRDVNIALANELAKIAEKMAINAWDVVRLANLHPRVNIHQPGPGVGGHCISVDPWFLVEQCPDEAQLIHQARKTNDGMPLVVADKLVRLVRPGKKIAVLGLAYKGNVDDIRESPAIEAVHLLQKAGFEVATHDPLVKRCEYELHPLENALEGAEAVVLLTGHDEFKRIDPAVAGKLMGRRLLLDTRNFLAGGAWREAGFQVVTLGDGTNADTLSRVLI